MISIKTLFMFFKHVVFSFSIVTSFSFSAFSQNYERPPAFVKKVYNDIYKSLNNGRLSGQPELVYITDNDNYIVGYKPGFSTGTNGQLKVGSNFIKMIRSFEKDSMNALAFVLGHELAHIILKQSDDIERIGSGYADNDFKKNFKSVKDSMYAVVFERQADENAMFFSHIGGYQTTHIASKVLKTVYSYFKLPNKLKKYPSLEERLLIVRASENKMKVLNELFDFASIAMVNGKHAISQSIYSIIISEGFKSSEVYNNMGLSIMLEVIESDTLFQKYELPCFIDSKSKMITSNQRAFDDFDPEEKIKLAINYFNDAMNSGDYPIANLNLSIAYFLSNLINPNSVNIDESEYYLRKVNKIEIPQAITMKGIIEHYKGNLIEAKKILGSNVEVCVLSKRNLNRLFFPIDSPFIQNNPLEQLNKLNFLTSSAVFHDPINKKKLINSDTLVKLIASASNLRYSVLKIDSIEYVRLLFTDLPTDKRSIYISKINNHEFGTSISELEIFSDKIMKSNLYTFYQFKNWIIRVDDKKNKVYYFLN